MSYMLVIKGSGQGCDYTLGCNQTSIDLDADTREEALAEAREMCPDDSWIYWEKADLVEFIEELPVAEWMEADRLAAKTAEAKRDDAADRAEYDRLHAKFGKTS